MPTRKAPVLDVVAVISNPVRYHSRERLWNDFVAMARKEKRVRLTLVEGVFGNRPPSVTIPGQPGHIQVALRDELWHKENLLQIGIQSLPRDAEFIAWIDADIQFAREDWASETIEQLRHYDIVQMFSHAVDLGPRREAMQTHTGFGYLHVEDRVMGAKWQPGYVFAHPGYAWAARRSFFDSVGGLMDWTLLGAGDHIMALALLGRVNEAIHGSVQKACPDFMNLAYAWQEHAASLKGNLGYVPGTISHFFHGAKADRKYVERWSVIADHKYSPIRDIRRNSHGVLELAGNKPQMRDDLRKYFRQRREDSLLV
jgi:hypothetical protein